MSKCNPMPGETVASFFRRNGKLSGAARLGAQKKISNKWETVSLRYRVKEGDILRVRPAQGRSSNSRGLLSLAKTIVLAQKG